MKKQPITVWRLTVALGALLAAATPRTGTAQGYSATVCAKGQGGITLSVQGSLIVLKGGICPGDNVKFDAFLAAVDSSIRTIKLTSGGGNGQAAQAMGRIIRERGYRTYVDGAKDRCASACTHIFAAGVTRHYAGATTITTGVDAARGLGYHYPNSRHTDETDADKDKGFNAMTVPYLSRMLSPAGAQAVVALMSGNRTTKVTWLNGDEALRAGIATTLDAPK